MSFHTITDLQNHVLNCVQAKRFFCMHISQESEVLEFLNSINSPYERTSLKTIKDGETKERNVAISHYDKELRTGFNVFFYERYRVIKPQRKLRTRTGIAQSLAVNKF